MPRRRKEWSSSSESLEKLLSFLDPNRERAGERYELLRERLIRIFERRGCNHPDEVADETFLRVESLLDQGKEVESKDREGFVIETGKHVLQEYWDKRRIEPQAEPEGRPVSPTHDVREAVFDLGLHQLPDRDRDLLSKYLGFGSVNQGIKPKIRRERLARQEGVGTPELRVRIFRIRAKLMKQCLCCFECLHR